MLNPQQEESQMRMRRSEADPLHAALEPNFRDPPLTAAALAPVKTRSAADVLGICAAWVGGTFRFLAWSR